MKLEDLVQGKAYWYTCGQIHIETFFCILLSLKSDSITLRFHDLTLCYERPFDEGRVLKCLRELDDPEA